MKFVYAYIHMHTALVHHLYHSSACQHNVRQLPKVIILPVQRHRRVSTAVEQGSIVQLTFYVDF